MNVTPLEAEHADRRLLLGIIGLLLLAGGIAVGLLAPVELYCFYLFEEGGRFHYPGFGFGSFMFGNIASQIVAYYLIAAVLIPLGYGHLTLRRWARVLSVALLWAWLVVGAPLTLLASFILLASKDLPLPAAALALVALAASYLVVPPLLIRFYQGSNVRRTFETRHPAPSWIEDVPVPLLVLSVLYLFYIVVLHLLILFNGLFPVFGTFRTGYEGIVLLDIAIACLALITWGTLRRRAWAWWGAVVLGGAFGLSTVVTLARSTWAGLLADLAFPGREVAMLDGVPVEGYHFAALAGLPLLLTWALAVRSRRHFRAGL